MTENNAAQAVQESERNAAVEEYFGHRTWIKPTASNFRLFEAGFDRAYALLSKLRAEGVQAGDERAAFEAHMKEKFGGLVEPWDARRGRYGFGPDNTRWEGWHDRAALASAPVAGEVRKLPTINVGGQDRPQQWFTAKEVRQLLDAAPQASKPDFADAYEGAREDLAIWKRRAQEAENLLRIERDTSRRLVAELNAANGPTHMGEPAPQASEADDLIGALGQCRDAFPISATAGSPLDLLWQEAMSDPSAVPAYVKACASNGQASEAVRDVLAELVRLQDAKDSQAHLPNPQRSNEWAEYRRLWPPAMEQARAALKTQADKDGGDCAKGAGDGDLHFIAGTIVLHLNGPLDPARVIAASRAIKDWIDRQQRAALSPTPSVVKQSLTATQTGEKGESDA